MMTLPAFMPAIAEMWLAGSALFLVVAGVCTSNRLASAWSRFAIAALICAMVAAIKTFQTPIMTFGEMFVQDHFALAFKGLITVGCIAGLLLALPYFSKRQESKFEYPLLILLAAVGMFGMVSAHDFLALYVSLELQSLSLYVLASFRRDTRFNAEAGLKYFFLGALSSGILLFGISLIYGFIGSTSYLAIGNTLAQQVDLNPVVILGLVMVVSGIAFKLAAAPFHMWAPDVYQGAATPVTALFSMAPKAAAIAVLCRLISGPFLPVFEQVQQIIIALAVLSMAVGSFAGIAQNNLKRLLAYSAIGHIGFILMALTVPGAKGISAAFYYTSVYVITSIGAFAFALAVFQNRENNETLESLAGLACKAPVYAACFAILLLSMAGIPPMVGFMAKIAVFKVALEAGLVWLVVTGVLFSVVSAYYYLRIIKIMYFDKPAKDALEIDHSLIWSILLVVSAVASIVLLLMPTYLSQWADYAARTF